MKRGIRFSLWLAATLVTTAIAYVAVNAAGSEVNNQPLTGVIAASPPLSTLGSSTTVIATTSSATAPEPTSTPTSLASSPSSSSSSTAVTATSATSAPTTAEPWQQTTLNSGGGSMIVSYRSGEVRLESVVPSPGFAYEIKDDGPDKVEVEFEGGDAKYSLRAEWTSDGFVTEIDADED